MDTETLKRAAYISVTAAASLTAAWLLFKYAAPVAVPFAVGWLVSLAVRPAAKWVSEKTKAPYKVTAVLILMLALLILSVLAVNGIGKLTAEAGRMMSGMIGDLESDDNVIKRVISSIDNAAGKLPWLGRLMSETKLGDTVYRLVFDAVSSLASNISGKLTEAAGNIVKAMPTAVLGAVSGVLACFYLTLDTDGFAEAVKPLVPAKVRGAAKRVKESLSGALGSYVRAYLILLLIIFGELFLGFTVLRIEYSFVLAAVIAVIDLLPVLGVGTVLVPWCIVCLIVGDYRLGIGLTVLFAVTELVRQLIEPHLIGKQMGIHPLVPVIAVYAGFRLFGIVGMITAPIAAYFVFGENGLRSLIAKK